MMLSARYWTVVAMLMLGVVTLYRRGDKDDVPESTPLSSFPATFDGRASQDIEIPQESLDVLGKGIFLNRAYLPVPGQASSGEVSLFIAYFPTQRSGQSIHSPQNCLPGSGWTFESSGVVDVTDTTGKTSQVGDYVIVNGASRSEVLYWYQSHGRAIASDYKAKLYMLADSIRYARSDAALVRVVAPMLPNDRPEDVHRRAMEFTQKLIPLLPAYIPN